MSETQAISLKRTSALLAALAFIAALTALNFASIFSARAGAAQLQNRSLTLSSSSSGDEAVGDPGSETNGSAATHTFEFDAEAASDTVVFLYCTTAIGNCTAPTGLDLSAAAVGALTNASGTISDTAANELTLSGGVTSAATTSVEVTDITNPTTVAPFFVRITTEDAGPVIVDDGTVASAITEGIYITSRVAETLGFSTTADFDTGVGDPSTTCDPLTGSGAITLGDPVEQTLSINSAYDNYSAFRLYTNAANGVAVQYEGDTLRRTPTSEIESISIVDSSQVGEEQFGLAIDPVTTGGAVTVTSRDGITDTLDFTYVDQTADFADVNNGALSIAAGYGTGNGTIVDGGTAQFLFVEDTPTTIASAASFTNCKTAAVRYLANISPLTPAGTYTTTIVYSAVPVY